ncbi:hypothetical protein [Paenibacillus lutrae]|uniref:Uncharacterized protein n=1 Tax=Paenibacillus lutrae TaxID=2078573 RepID=A0A7X3FG52_9BACL|nr:hypothetical protein [Paenibacillus lutrae]MVO99066.1 hypothetical protein [Paenibacillus lutrae]
MLHQKRIYSTILGIVIVGGMALAGNQFIRPAKPANEPAHQNQEGVLLSTAQADHKVFNHLQELESFSDVIIEASVASPGTVEEFFQNGHKIDAANKVQVKVNRSYKGDLKEGNEITVYEPGYMKDGLYVNIEGYKTMNTSGKYMLFLSKAPTGTYAVEGVYQGKFDLNIQQEAKLTDYKTSPYTMQEFEKLDYVGYEMETFNSLKKEVLSKYGSQ